ncbi:SCO family protein [Massilia horti]|uniref:SCO family protein n=2 Tax=Massilia horti TaxID=2562153 RepID=A0A4Y9T361_9BURK|nr:SCO family protein [Massilia horti]
MIKRAPSLLLSLFLSLQLASSAHAADLKSGVFEPPRPAPELALVTSSGKPFRLADYRGKVVILEFGYTHCPAICPTLLATLAQARALMKSQAARVQVVFVTVDPARDDNARLAAWLPHFDPAFVGLTGNGQQVGAVMKAFGITATRVPMANGGYGIDHSSYLYFIDPKGILRALMPFGRPAADIAHDARVLLEEGA